MDLTEEQWAVLQPLFPQKETMQQGVRGRPYPDSLRYSREAAALSEADGRALGRFAPALSAVPNVPPSISRLGP